MNWKAYHTPGEFLEDNRAFLQAHEAACQLNIGNAVDHRDEPCRPDLLFGRWEDGSDPVLLAGLTAPWNLCLNNLPGDPRAEEAARQMALLLEREAVSFGGVNAQQKVCEAFFSASPYTFALRTAMDIMVLTRVVPPPAAPGYLRKASPEDLDLALAWDLNFHREALHEAPDPALLREKVRDHLERGTVWLWVLPDGTPAATACLTRPMAHGVSISGVYTLPEYRGRGCCQNLVAALCGQLLSGGYEYCTLFVDRKNPVSNRAYLKVGFAVTEDNCDYRKQEKL